MNQTQHFKIRTESVRYTLPASRIRIDEIAEQFENAASLADITIIIEVSGAGSEQVAMLQEAADRESFDAVLPPVNFTVRAEFGGQSIEVRKFGAYVERELILPEGTDPMKVTTGVILHGNGSVTHVPTYIVRHGDRYAVRLNSLTNSAYAVIYNPKTFADAEDHWAGRWINEMGSRKVVEGKSGNEFHPDDPVTRAEFAAMLVRGLGLSDEADASAGTVPYTDVRRADWHYGAVMKASEYGLVKGDGEGAFRPGDSITREQAMVMLQRAMAIAGVTADAGAADDILSRFRDGDAVSDWAKSAAAGVVQAGIFTGSAEALRPQETMTRAEAAVVLHRLLTAAQLINPIES